MLGGNNNANGNNGGVNFGQMMAYSMFMGDGKNNPFEGMFDFDIDEGEKADETEENED